MKKLNHTTRCYGSWLRAQGPGSQGVPAPPLGRPCSQLRIHSLTSVKAPPRPQATGSCPPPRRPPPPATPSNSCPSSWAQSSWIPSRNGSTPGPKTIWVPARNISNPEPLVKLGAAQPRCNLCLGIPQCILLKVGFVSRYLKNFWCPLRQHTASPGGDYCHIDSSDEETREVRPLA